jgi:hypothetical protein
MSVQGDKLFSGSYDGSVKMWTLVRAVELKSFKYFDDSVSSIQNLVDGFVIGMSNRVIHFDTTSQSIVKITNLENTIIGFSLNGSSVLVATKTIRSLRVKQYYSENTSLVDPEVFIELSDSCSAVFVDEMRQSFWLGLRDGTILYFSWKTNNYEKTVIPLIHLYVCRK